MFLLFSQIRVNQIGFPREKTKKKMAPYAVIHPGSRAEPCGKETYLQLNPLTAQFAIEFVNIHQYSSRDGWMNINRVR